MTIEQNSVFVPSEFKESWAIFSENFHATAYQSGPAAPSLAKQDPFWQYRKLILDTLAHIVFGEPHSLTSAYISELTSGNDAASPPNIEILYEGIFATYENKSRQIFPSRKQGTEPKPLGTPIIEALRQFIQYNSGSGTNAAMKALSKHMLNSLGNQWMAYRSSKSPDLLSYQSLPDSKKAAANQAYIDLRKEPEAVFLIAATSSLLERVQKVTLNFYTKNTDGQLKDDNKEGMHGMIIEDFLATTLRDYDPRGSCFSTYSTGRMGFSCRSWLALEKRKRGPGVLFVSGTDGGSFALGNIESRETLVDISDSSEMTEFLKSCEEALRSKEDPHRDLAVFKLLNNIGNYLAEFPIIALQALQHRQLWSILNTASQQDEVYRPENLPGILKAESKKIPLSVAEPLSKDPKIQKLFEEKNPTLMSCLSSVKPSLELVGKHMNLLMPEAASLSRERVRQIESGVRNLIDRNPFLKGLLGNATQVAR